ncbi:MAG: ATP-binding protein [Bacteroidetes bacterium]|nr:ATP-binding protein [Bacteroidota bacterium]
MASQKEFHNEYSSRIKKIFIQLHDYQYYHCPYEETHGDRRFIGREKILDKLKSLFTNAEYSTGAYLITGYRGSGKTSLVNKVICDIENRRNFLNGNLIGYILIPLFYFLFSFFCLKWMSEIAKFHPYLIKIIASVFLLFISFFLATLLIVFIKNISIKNRLNWWSPKDRILNILARVFFIKDLSFQEKKYFTAYLPWYCLTLIPIMFCLIYFICNTQGSSYSYLTWLCIPYYSMLIINIGKNLISAYKNFNTTISTDNWRSFFTGFLKFRTNIFIKLNLGHTKLREVDILKLLARNLKTELIKYYRTKTFARVILSLVIFYFIYTMTYLIYYQPAVFRAHNVIKTQIGFNQYFRSQDSVFLIRQEETKPFLQVDRLYKECQDNITTLFHETKYPSYINFQHKTVLEYMWEKTATAVSVAIVFIDTYVYLIYYYSRKILIDGFLFGHWISLQNPSINSHYNGYWMTYTLIPYHLDYFFLIYILCLYFLCRKLLLNRIFQAKSPKEIIKKIKDLNEIIVSEVTVDKMTLSSEKSNFNLFSFLSPKTKKRSLADVREIEKYLSEILDDINQIRFPYSRPDIVVVFDELDKIETHTYNVARMTEEKVESDTGLQNLLKQPNPSFTIDGTRERQQTLQLLLSNLKYFLSDANAKFIFIAGREMYDASLADISDRNYFMGSIFHDVINVNSFLSDKTDSKPSDITSMIEKYICQFIIHPSYIDFEIKRWEKEKNQKKERLELYTLQTFNKFLIDSFGDKYNENENDDQTVADKILARQQREKVVNTIQHFIIYLTHASNGAPKKITNYFENFIEFLSLKIEYKNKIGFQKKEEQPKMIISLYESKWTQNRQNPYLVFNYNHQHELGVINYITLPIILSISNHIKNYGDKLLVSATFLFDHILKFHKDGFSWRNIEYIPEILEINRTPELRGFISDVLNHLLQTHLQVILTGLYTYRFNLRLSNEISFLSRVSEEASASFNFTLDESLAIKHYYHSLLTRLEDRYKKISLERTEYIHSIAMVHTILGDLYFHDEEYNDSIIEYMDSIQSLRYQGFSDENFSLLLILIRNMLRLGLAFEKRKTFSSAYETYNELCLILIKNRYINLKEIGLYEKTNKEGKTILVGPSIDDPKLGDNWNEANNPIRTFQENFPRENHYSSSDEFFATKDTFINRITIELNPLIEKIIGKISSFEGLRLIYQPLLARTQIMEKCILGGIKSTDIFRVEKEFAFLQKAINQNEKYLIKIEFYNKLGDILFFKKGNVELKKDQRVKINSCNCSLNSRQKVSNPIDWCDSKEWNYLEYEEINNQKDRIENFKDRTIYNVNDSDLEKVTGPEMHCAACSFYLYSLRLYTINTFNGSSIGYDKLQSVTSTYNFLIDHYEALFTMSHTSIRILGGLISDIADAQFGCYRMNYFDTDIKDIFKFLENPKPGTDGVSQPYSFSLTGIIQQYYFSAKMYKKANDMKGYIWQLTKILYILKEFLQNITIHNHNLAMQVNLQNMLTNCEMNIVRKAIRGCWASYENAHMNEVSKQKRNISYDLDNPGQASLNRSSVNSDVEEINLLFSEIKMLVWDINFINNPIEFMDSNAGMVFKGLVPELYLKNLVSPYSETDTIINRISRLNYKVKLNFRLFKQLLSHCFNINIEDIMPLNELKLNERNSTIPKGGDTSFWYMEYLKIIATNYKYFFLNDEIKLMDDNDPNIFKMVRISELFCHLISDSMYCLNEIIEISNAYGRSYILNNSFIGAAHEKMLFWSIWYIALESNSQFIYEPRFINDPKILSLPKVINYDNLFNNLSDTLQGYLMSWMDHDALESQSIVYHAEMAVKRYYSAYETHIGGKSYRYFIDKMFFLNDDFNDKFSHFFAALERFSLNNKNIGNKIDTIKKFNEISKLYQYEYFTKTQY